jgi:hypothetical protein
LCCCVRGGADHGQGSYTPFGIIAGASFKLVWKLTTIRRTPAADPDPAAARVSAAVASLTGGLLPASVSDPRLRAPRRTGPWPPPPRHRYATGSPDLEPRTGPSVSPWQRTGHRSPSPSTRTGARPSEQSEAARCSAPQVLAMPPFRVKPRRARLTATTWEPHPPVALPAPRASIPSDRYQPHEDGVQAGYRWRDQSQRGDPSGYVVARVQRGPQESVSGDTDRMQSSDRDKQQGGPYGEGELPLPHPKA